MSAVSAIILLVLIFVVLGVLPMVGTPLIAARKGFKWYYWLLAGSLFGLLLVAILPAANQSRLSEEEQERRRHKGDRAGSGLTFFSVGVVVVSIVMGVRDSRRETAVWQSRFHPIRVPYGPPWTLIEGARDSEDAASVGFVDTSGGKSYSIRVDADVPQAELPDVKLFPGFREYVLRANRGIRLIDAADGQLHGVACRRFRFWIRTDEGQTVCTYVYLWRAAGKRVGLEWSFPCEADAPDPDRIPEEIESLDRGVVLFEREAGDRASP